MTRINCIPPSELCRQHLVAEYRELPRVFALARAARLRGESPDDPRNPRQYVLGAGHVRFFYDKLEYLRQRYRLLVQEMRRRGYTVNFGWGELWAANDDHPTSWLNDWEPDETATALNRARIEERMPA